MDSGADAEAETENLYYYNYDEAGMFEEVDDDELLSFQNADDNETIKVSDDLTLDDFDCQMTSPETIRNFENEAQVSEIDENFSSKRQRPSDNNSDIMSKKLKHRKLESICIPSSQELSNDSDFVSSTRTEKPELPSLDSPFKSLENTENTNVNISTEESQASTSPLASGAYKQKVALSSEGGKWYQKRNFCLYCKSLQLRIDKHLLSNHLKEERVHIASLIPAGNPDRRKLLAKIRIDGNDLYNSSKELNPEGVIICARRQRINKKAHVGFKAGNSTNSPSSVSQKVSAIGRSLGTSHEKQSTNDTASTEFDGCERNPEKYVSVGHDNDVAKPSSNMKEMQTKISRMKCPHCSAYFAFTNLRNHIRLRHPSEALLGTRQMLTLSKQSMGLCHPKASKSTKEYLLPQLRLDPVGIAVRYDLLIILFANKFVQKYSDVDQLQYVRGHMRLLGKVLLQLQKINPRINELLTVFRASYWPTFLEAIHQVCELDSKRNRFLIIYNAETLPLLIRKCIKILKNYFTVQEDEKALGHIVSFEKVFEDEIEFQVLYKAVLSRKEANRHKNGQKLPRSDDICTFENYLNLKRSVSVKEIENGNVDVSHWTNIVETTACLILLYNRRRVGEISKTLLKDYEHARKADPSSEFFNILSDEEKKQRLKYTRIDIQGKRIDGKGSLYISEQNEYGLNLIKKYRHALGVKLDNPYLFGLPDKTANNQPKHISICNLMSKLSKECSNNYKQIDDQTIRGTLLRKQLATFNAAIPDGNATVASKHLGHSVNVHHTYYKLAIDGEDVAVTNMLDTVNQASTSQENVKNKDKATTKEKTHKNYKRLVIRDTESDSSDDSDSTEEQLSEENAEPSGVLKKMFGIKGKIQRRSWTSDELDAFDNAFRECIETNRYPTAEEMRRAQRENPVLCQRSENVIRARFSNMFKGSRNKKSKRIF